MCIREVLCVQEVVTPIHLVTYYIKWVTTSWTDGIKALVTYITQKKNFKRNIYLFRRLAYLHQENILWELNNRNLDYYRFFYYFNVYPPLGNLTIEISSLDLLKFL